MNYIMAVMVGAFAGVLSYGLGDYAPGGVGGRMAG